MLVYRVQNEILGSNVVWRCWPSALEEIESFFDCDHEDVNEPNTITLSIEEMTQQEFESLPEFPGY